MDLTDEILFKIEDIEKCDLVKLPQQRLNLMPLPQWHGSFLPIFFKIFSPEFQKINPNGKVPVLKDGEFVLSESWAIAWYILDKYVPENNIYPNVIKERAQIDMDIDQLNDLMIS